VKSGLAAARARGKKLGRQTGQRPKSALYARRGVFSATFLQVTESKAFLDGKSTACAEQTFGFFNLLKSKKEFSVP
jgi:hypothetical protein